MKKIVLIFCILCATHHSMAQNVTARFSFDNSTIKSSVVFDTEYNLGKLLTEINSACNEGREIHTVGIPMTDFARKAVTTLWKNIHFKTERNDIKDRLWIFQRNRMMEAHHIPIILVDDSPLNNNRQDAVVEFTLDGKISDFRFAIDPEVSESLESSEGNVAELEEQAIIRKYVERFRTAYNEKDIDFLNRMFSDDALIITGNVVNVKTAEEGFRQKVVYNKYNKTQYLQNLLRCFKRNKWIKVNFSLIDNPAENGGKSKFITHRKGKDGRNYYGVRLRQEWHSSRGYHDEGYVFLLWEFPENGDPMIHVRTWQPEKINGRKLEINEIFSEVDFNK
ncbi:MAG: hypothetical protein J6I31_00885 [Prevotella sp.]|nr:hypothetical protein [Prevotella sp.]